MAERVHTQLQLEMASHLLEKRLRREERLSLEPWLVLVGQVGAAKSYCSVANGGGPTGRG